MILAPWHVFVEVVQAVAGTQHRFNVFAGDIDFHAWVEDAVRVKNLLYFLENCIHIGAV